MEKSFPFNASLVNGQYDRVYTAEDFAAERAAYISNGILTEESLSAVPIGGMSVQITAGMACIHGRTYWNTEPMNMTLENASATLSRIDLIAVRLDLTKRTMELICLRGNYAEYPTAPTPVSGGEITDLPIAQISVPAGTLEIGMEHIMDMRVMASFPLDAEKIANGYVEELKKILGAEDLEALKQAAGVISCEGDGSKFLSDDGSYVPVSNRKELVRFTTSGTFNPADYPSSTGLYDIMLLGGGGSGASIASYKSPSGGSAGGFAFESGIRLNKGTSYTVTIGAGGASKSGTNVSGNDGGSTSFGGFTVPGGKGGFYDNSVSASAVTTAGVTVGIYTSESGTGWVESDMMGTYVNYFSKGGDSFFGVGGSLGQSGSGYGAGGGGNAGGASGAGSNGLVIVYGY